jgi:catechol 2,3-dioxygenase-like lactoylglutathione lyase family enzyme
MSSPAETPMIRSIGFTCRDAEALATFYSNRLVFKRPGTALIVEGGTYAELVGLPGSRLQLLQLQIGAEILELMQVLELGPGLRPGRPIPADSRSCDLWFQHICLVVADMAAAAAPIQAEVNSGHLQPISSAPQTLPAWNQAAAGIQAYKFHDPEGHCLELLQFPPDKGEARWHQRGKPGNTGSPVLGMDHSAIAVADTRRSCAFYEELLGLRLGGDGINSGNEQDLLDGLEGTRVQITSHRCLQGPGIECLNYRQPMGGRPLPSDQSASDTAHWQIRLAVNDLKAIAERVETYGGNRLAGPLTLTDTQAELLGFRQALQIRDPDGHALQLVSDGR